MNPRVRVAVPLAIGHRLKLSPDAARHLVVVLRRGVGSQVDLVDGDGTAWSAMIVALEPVEVEVMAACRALDANPAVAVGLWLPVLKGGKSDGLIRHLTEIGVCRVTPYLSRRTIVRLDDAKARQRQKRWQTIADEATRQCRRTDRLHVAPVHRGIPGPEEPAGVVLYEQRYGDGEGIATVPRNALTNVLIGPEGGLELSEVDALLDSGWTVSWLGPRVLRAETAVIVGATLALARLGEFSGG